MVENGRHVSKIAQNGQNIETCSSPVETCPHLLKTIRTSQIVQAKSKQLHICSRRPKHQILVEYGKKKIRIRSKMSKQQKLVENCRNVSKFAHDGRNIKICSRRLKHQHLIEQVFSLV